MKRYGSVEGEWKREEKAGLQLINPRTKGPGLKTSRVEVFLTGSLGIESGEQFHPPEAIPLPLHPPSKHAFWNRDCCAWHTADIQ